jgi:hypothetical protein
MNGVKPERDMINDAVLARRLILGCGKMVAAFGQGVASPQAEVRWSSVWVQPPRRALPLFGPILPRPRLDWRARRRPRSG